MQQKTITEDDTAATDTENWGETWDGLSPEKAIKQSQIIEDVSITDGLVQVYLERAPRYITEVAEIHQVNLEITDENEAQRFPYGFDMAGQSVQFSPEISETEGLAEDASLKIMCSIEVNGNFNSTMMRLPLAVSDGELGIDYDCARAGYDEHR